MIPESGFAGRLGLQQRVLPAYRVAFFDALARSCKDGLSIFSGRPTPGEMIRTTDRLEVASNTTARNLHIGQVRSPLYLCWQFGILKWLEITQPDALILEANPRYLSNRLAIRWMHARSRPVLGWGLGAPARRGFLEFLMRGGRKGYISEFDGLIAYSQRGAEEYRDLGFPPENVFVALNAGVQRPVNPPAERPASFGERPVLLFVGRLQSRKRIELLFTACAGLPPEIQPEVWVVGDGPARSEFQDVARRVYPRAVFHGAHHGDDLEPFFIKADLFVLPGTGGLAVQQAMSYGLPVIVAEGDGTQDDLVQSGNGWRVTPGDSGSLKAALLEALRDAPRLRRMGRESYRIVSEEANIECMVGTFIQALDTIVDGFKVRRETKPPDG